MASGVHKNTDTKVETVSANSVCRQLPQKTAEQGLAAAGAFAEEVQWSLAIRRTISGVGFGEALKLLMNDREVQREVRRLRRNLGKESAGEIAKLGLTKLLFGQA